MSEQINIILPIPESVINEFKIFSKESGLPFDMMIKSLSDYVVSGFTNNLEIWLTGWRKSMEEIEIAETMDELENINKTKLN